MTAVAGIAGAYNSPARFAERMGRDTYRAALTGMLARYDEFLPAVAPDGAEAMAADETAWLECDRHVDLYDAEP